MPLAPSPAMATLPRGLTGWPSDLARGARSPRHRLISQTSGFGAREGDGLLRPLPDDLLAPGLWSASCSDPTAWNAGSIRARRWRTSAGCRRRTKTAAAIWSAPRARCCARWKSRQGFVRRVSRSVACDVHGDGLGACLCKVHASGRFGIEAARRKRFERLAFETWPYPTYQVPDTTVADRSSRCLCASIRVWAGTLSLIV